MRRFQPRPLAQLLPLPTMTPRQDQHSVEINTQLPFKPDAGQLFQHGRRKEHYVGYRMYGLEADSVNSSATMANDKSKKDKIRKSGRSLQEKTMKLGRVCDVFSALVYWNPTHRRMERVMHLPRGQTMPDVNRLVCVLPDGPPIAPHRPVANSTSYARWRPTALVPEQALA